MQPLQVVSLLLDNLLVIAAVASYIARPRIGGQLSKGLRTLLVGLMILGFAHFIETSLFVLFSISTEVNEIVHRLVVALAFIFVIMGLATMRQAFEE